MDDTERHLQDALTAITGRLSAIETDLRLIRTNGLPSCPAHSFIIDDHVCRLKGLDSTTDRIESATVRLALLGDAFDKRMAVVESRIEKLEVAEGRRGLVVLTLSTLGVGIGIGLGYVLKFVVGHQS